MSLAVKNLPANAGDVRDTGLIPGSGRSPGGGHGNPPHYSCLENPMDRGAWWATVHRVIKSLTWLKWLSMHAHDLERSHQSGPPECVGKLGTWTLLRPNGKWYVLFPLKPPGERKGGLCGHTCMDPSQGKQNQAMEPVVWVLDQIVPASPVSQ